MIECTEDYRAAITGDTRRILLKAIIDIISPDIVYGTCDTSGQTAYSKPEQLHNKVFAKDEKYATLEHNRWKLDGSFDVLPDAPTDTVGEIGYMGDALSGEDGVFATPVWVEMQFSNVSILQACSVFFPDNGYDGIPVDFTIEVKQGGVARCTKEFTGNTAASVALEGFTVNDPDAIRVTVTKWSKPSRRMRVVEIVPGIYEEWSEDIFAAFSVKQQGDVSCVSLPYGTCTLSMNNLSRRFEPRRKNGVFQSIEERQGIDVAMGVQLKGGKDDYKRLGIFYQYSGGWKTGDNGLTMQWTLVDIIGLLAEREFILPSVLPTTLNGWIAVLAAQLGRNFAERYHVDPDYAELPVTAEMDAVTGMKCGDILKYVCMATGTWPRADAETGDLTAEPLWNQGNKITLDNLTSYPTIKANDDLAAVIFTLSDGTQYVVSGNTTGASKTVSVKNPFLHTQAQALSAARAILSVYGGNKYELTGRGDPASEIGDVDTIWLDESSATTARRTMQSFQMQNGVLRNCRSTAIQADGSFLFQSRAVITESGTWTAPTGATQLRLILVGKGSTGTAGTDGTWSEAGGNGTDGVGGKVWAGTININDGQSFTVSIGNDTAFGTYSSAKGARFEYGYTDIASGESYARTGVANPLPGSGDGGKAGSAGRKGNKHTETVQKYTAEGEFIEYTKTVIDNHPGSGTAGVNGAFGCAVVYWDEVTA